MSAEIRPSAVGVPLGVEAGRWYAIGFLVGGSMGAESMEYGEVLRYDGDGCWSNDDGEPVDGLFDPELQCMVAMDAADDYVRQG